MKNSGSFKIFTKNIDLLEPPRAHQTVLKSTHNLCFRAEIRKLMFTPVNPSFTI